MLTQEMMFFLKSLSREKNLKLVSASVSVSREEFRPGREGKQNPLTSIRNRSTKAFSHRVGGPFAFGKEVVIEIENHLCLVPVQPRRTDMRIAG
jgi:hypothetical protein